MAAYSAELAAPAAVLERPELEPACAAACELLLTDLETSPLLNPALPADSLPGRIRRIRDGVRGVTLR